MMEFPSSGSSKRAKTGVSGINVNVSCLVDGCNSDLSLCREYHRRHKVCAIHSKTAKVTIGGREQRFCQQCSRFHSLAEFDDGKRSCRKRLDGHNRRRRKPLSDSLSRTSGMFFSGEQGTTILSFSSPQIHPSAVVSPSAWTGPVKLEDESMLLSSHRPINLFPGQTSAVSYNKGVNQFQFLQGTDRIHLPEAGNSDRALSLLSSSGSTHSQTRNNMVSTQMLQPGQTQTSLMHSPQFSRLRHFPFSLEMDNKGPELSDSNANNQNNTTLQFLGMFHNVPEGSSVVTGDQQTLSFRWK